MRYARIVIRALFATTLLLVLVLGIAAAAPDTRVAMYAAIVALPPGCVLLEAIFRLQANAHGGLVPLCATVSALVYLAAFFVVFFLIDRVRRR